MDNITASAVIQLMYFQQERKIIGQRSSDWLLYQQTSYVKLDREHCLCENENEEVNMSTAVHNKFFGISCDSSGQVGLIHFTPWKAYEVAACQ